MNDNQKDKNMNSSPIEKSKRFNQIFYGLIVICGALFVAEFFYKKKAGLAIEAIPALHIIFALVSILVVMTGVRILRQGLSRDEGYYAPRDVDSETYPQEDTSRESTND